MNHEKASDTRIQANRENAKHSTGPRTPEGKEISKLNSLTHGFTSNTVVLRYEDPQEYDELHNGFIQEYSPAGPTESALVKTITNTTWRLRRLELIETELFNAVEEIPVEDASGIAFFDTYRHVAKSLLKGGSFESALNTLNRFQTSLNRQFHQALKALYAAQERRRKEERETATREAVHNVTGVDKRPEPERRRLDLIAADVNVLRRYIRAETDIDAATGVLDPANLNAGDELQPAA